MIWEFSFIYGPHSPHGALHGFHVQKRGIDCGVEVKTFACIPLDQNPRPLADFIADLEIALQQLKALEHAK